MVWFFLTEVSNFFLFFYNADLFKFAPIRSRTQFCWCYSGALTTRLEPLSRMVWFCNLWLKTMGTHNIPAQFLDPRCSHSIDICIPRQSRHATANTQYRSSSHVPTPSCIICCWVNNNWIFKMRDRWCICQDSFLSFWFLNKLYADTVITLAVPLAKLSPLLVCIISI